MSTTDTYFRSYADAAALMVASVVDPEGAEAVIRDLFLSASPDELREALHAALVLGGRLLAKESEHSATEHDGAPGPALEYAVAASTHASDLAASND